VHYFASCVHLIIEKSQEVLFRNFRKIKVMIFPKDLIMGQMIRSGTFLIS